LDISAEAPEFLVTLLLTGPVCLRQDRFKEPVRPWERYEPLDFRVRIRHAPAFQPAAGGRGEHPIWGPDNRSGGAIKAATASVAERHDIENDIKQTTDNDRQIGRRRRRGLAAADRKQSLQSGSTDEQRRPHQRRHHTVVIDNLFAGDYVLDNSGAVSPT